MSEKSFLPEGRKEEGKQDTFTDTINGWGHYWPEVSFPIRVNELRSHFIRSVGQTKNHSCEAAGIDLPLLCLNDISEEKLYPSRRTQLARS